MVQHFVACACAWLGEEDRAMDHLEKAVRLGMRHKRWLENDSDLKALHGHRRFEELLRWMEAQDGMKAWSPDI